MNSRHTFLNQDLMAQLTDQFKIEYNQITGQPCEGNLCVMDHNEYFYFRTNSTEPHITVKNSVTGFTGEMSPDNVDFLASMLAITMTAWRLSADELFEYCEALHNECRSSRPEVVAFIK